jgi:hypothetical protein
MSTKKRGSVPTHLLPLFSVIMALVVACCCCCSGLGDANYEDWEDWEDWLDDYSSVVSPFGAIEIPGD